MAHGAVAEDKGDKNKEQDVPSGDRGGAAAELIIVKRSIILFHAAVVDGGGS